jgi:hypothetical protein
MRAVSEARRNNQLAPLAVSTTRQSAWGALWFDLAEIAQNTAMFLGVLGLAGAILLLLFGQG